MNQLMATNVIHGDPKVHYSTDLRVVIVETQEELCLLSGALLLNQIRLGIIVNQLVSQLIMIYVLIITTCNLMELSNALVQIAMDIEVSKL